jgi:hypothetical protein
MNHTPGARTNGWVWLGLAACALLVVAPGVALILRHGFDGLYGQDAFAYVDYARGPLTSALLGLQLPPWFYWPPGYPFLVALAASVPGVGDRAGQLVSLIAGAGIPVLTGLLAYELTDPRAGARPRAAVALLAGATAAATAQLWQSSIVAMADTTGAAAAIAGAWAVCRYVAGHRRRWLALGAGALALAIVTRWIYGLVAVPLAAAALATLWDIARSRPGAAGRDAALGALVATLVLLPTAVPMVDAVLHGQPLPFAADFAAYHWDAANAASRSVQSLDGRLVFDEPAGLFYLSQPIRRYWFWLIALLAIPGALHVLRRMTVTRVAVLLAWPSLVVAFLAGGGYQNTRFFLACMPPVAILIAMGAGAAWGAVRIGPPTLRALARATLVAALGAGLAANAVYAVGFADAFVARQTADLAAVRALAGQVSGDARLISLGPTAALRHEGRADVVELYWLDAESVLALVGDGRPTYLLVDIASIRGQWRGQPPGRAVDALAFGPGLELVDADGIWTLYRVGASTPPR